MTYSSAMPAGRYMPIITSGIPPSIISGPIRPAFLEEKAYRAQMLALQNKMFKNSVFAGYDQMRFGDDYKIVGYAQLGYNRKFKRSDLTAQVNYTGRDAVLEIEDDQATEESPGGRGLQFQVQYNFDLSDNWSLSRN